MIGFDELIAGLEELHEGNIDPVPDLTVDLDLSGSGQIDWGEWCTLAALSCASAGNLASDIDLHTCAHRLLDLPTCDGAACARDLAVLVAKRPGSQFSQVGQLQVQVLPPVTTTEGAAWKQLVPAVANWGTVKAAAGAGAGAPGLSPSDFRAMLKEDALRTR